MSIDTYAGAGPSPDFPSVPDGPEVEQRLALRLACLAGDPHPRARTVGDETGELRDALAADYQLASQGLRTD